MRNTQWVRVLGILVVVLLVGCGDGTGDGTEVAPTRSVVATPVSPLVQDSPLPTPTVTVVPPAFNKPLYAGDTVVAGTGPAGLPIQLHDFSTTGDIIGQGVIGEDGTFAIEVSTPLWTGQRVGLALQDLSNTTFDAEQFKPHAIIKLPVIGYIFEDETVQSK